MKPIGVVCGTDNRDRGPHLEHVEDEVEFDDRLRLDYVVELGHVQVRDEEVAAEDHAALEDIDDLRRPHNAPVSPSQQPTLTTSCNGYKTVLSPGCRLTDPRRYNGGRTTRATMAMAKRMGRKVNKKRNESAHWKKP